MTNDALSVTIKVLIQLILINKKLEEKINAGGILMELSSLNDPETSDVPMKNNGNYYR